MPPLFFFPRPGLQALLEGLSKRGFRVIGPTRRDGAIVYDDLRAIDDLPAGWRDEQEAGHYRLRRRDDGALFGYVVGPDSWKRLLFPASLRLWRARREKSGPGLQLIEEPTHGTPTAFVGVRACELEAIRVHDRVLLEGPFVDPDYRARRERTFIVAVNCGQAAATCFCLSMKSGPRCEGPFDLVLTEIDPEGRHGFVAEAGSARGSEILGELGAEEATSRQRDEADRAVQRAAGAMRRTLAPEAARELLRCNLAHPRWAEVAERCLACGNCTLVCPTCFCTTIEDRTDLAGAEASRHRSWDSCFTVAYSYIHGGSVRVSTRSRYRQWLTHKLSTWFDQFGTSGCVGCGRCISWCPVGIDITAEVRAIGESASTRLEPADAGGETDHGREDRAG